jgi:hypothetical protein
MLEDRTLPATLKIIQTPTFTLSGDVRLATKEGDYYTNYGVTGRDSDFQPFDPYHVDNGLQPPENTSNTGTAIYSQNLAAGFGPQHYPTGTNWGKSEGSFAVTGPLKIQILSDAGDKAGDPVQVTLDYNFTADGGTGARVGNPGGKTYIDYNATAQVTGDAHPAAVLYAGSNTATLINSSPTGQILDFQTVKNSRDDKNQWVVQSVVGATIVINVSIHGSAATWQGGFTGYPRGAIYADFRFNTTVEDTHPDLEATSLDWNTHRGSDTADPQRGLDFGYTASALGIPTTVNVAFYWAKTGLDPSTSPKGARVAPYQYNLLSAPLDLGGGGVITGLPGPHGWEKTADGRSIFNVEPNANWGTPPAGANSIVMVLDPNHLIPGLNRTDNAWALPFYTKAQILSHSVSVQIPDKSWIIAQFTPGAGLGKNVQLPLSEAEIVCGVQNFNWRQQITAVPNYWTPVTLSNLNYNDFVSLDSTGSPIFNDQFRLDKNGNVVGPNTAPVTPKRITVPFYDGIVNFTSSDPPTMNTRAFIVSQANGGSILAIWPNDPWSVASPFGVDANGKPVDPLNGCPIPDAYVYYLNQPDEVNNKSVLTDTGKRNPDPKAVFPYVVTPSATTLQFADRPTQKDVLFSQGGELSFETRLVGVGYDNSSYELWGADQGQGVGWRTNFTWKSNSVYEDPAHQYSSTNSAIGWGTSPKGNTLIPISGGGIFDVQYDDGSEVPDTLTSAPPLVGAHLVLAPIAAQSVAAHNTLTFAVTSTDPNLGHHAVYSLAAGSPTGAAVDLVTGVFTWTPHTSGTYKVTVIATDDGYSTLSASEAFTITVSPPAVLPGTNTSVTSLVAHSSSVAQTVPLNGSVQSAAGVVNEGTLKFSVYDSNNTPVGTSVSGNVINGSASANFSLPGGLPPGAYTIKAVYMPGPDYSGGMGSGALNVWEQLAFGTVYTRQLAQNAQYSFTFNGTAGQRLYYNALDGDHANVTVRIVAPSGVTALSPFNAGNNQYPFSLAESGPFIVTFTNNSTTNVDYSFQILDVAAQPAATLNQAINGTLVLGTGADTPAGISQLYQFTATAGERLLFHNLSVSANNAATWSLYGPDNKPIRYALNLEQDFVATLSTAGQYVLVLNDTSSQQVAYDLEVITPSVVQGSLQLGSLVSGSFGQAGGQQVYTFSGVSGQHLFLEWVNSTLSHGVFIVLDPTGQQVAGQFFNIINILGRPSAVNLPVSGTYRLVVQNDDTGMGAFRFRLVDAASQSVLSDGGAVGGTLDPSTDASPGNNAALFRVEAHAGQLLAFASQSHNDPSSSSFSELFGPDGKYLGGSVSIDQPFLVTAPVDGEYVLSLGNPGASAATYQLKLVVNPQPQTGTFSIGDTVAGAITVPGQSFVYTFSGTAGAFLHFDALSQDLNPITVGITSPSGVQVYGGPAYANQLLVLPESGAYKLTIAGQGATTGNYRFRLTDLSGAPAVTAGTPVSGTVQTAFASVAYSINGTAGQRLLFHNLFTGSSSGMWALYAQDGSSVSKLTELQNDFVADLPSDGKYLLALDSYSSQPQQYSFAASVPPTQAVPLTLGSVVTGSVSSPGEQHAYTFSGTAGEIVYYNGLQGSSTATMKLMGPDGSVLDSDSAQSSGPPIVLPATGTYKLILSATDVSLGTFAFRLLNVSDQPELSLNNYALGTLSILAGLPQPESEVAIYRVSGTPGERLSFDGRAFSAGPVFFKWTLFDPAGQPVGDVHYASDITTVTLPSSGQFFVVITGDTGVYHLWPEEYHFQLSTGLAPNVTITKATDPVNASAEANVAISGTTVTGGTVSVVATDGARTTSPVTASASGGTWSVHLDVSGLADGSITYLVTVTDVNNKSSTVQWQAVKDTVARIAITAATDPITAANQSAVTVSGTAEPGASISVLASDGIQNTTAVTTTADSTGAWSVSLSAASIYDGFITYRVTSTDLVGNTATVQAEAYKDTGLTNRSKVAQLSLSTVSDPVVASNQIGAQVSGRASAGSSVIVVASDGTHTSSAANATATAAGWSVSLDLSGLNDGFITYIASVTDSSGNTATVQRQAVKDTRARLTLLSLTDPVTQADQSGATVSGTTVSGSTISVVATDGTHTTNAATATADASGLWFANLDVHLLNDGTISFKVTATDIVGNTMTAQRQVTKFTVVPPTITTQPVSQTVKAGQTVSFSAAAVGPPPLSAQWQVSTDGGYTFSAVAGATSVTLTFAASQSQNGFAYRAVFGDAAGSSTSATATLVVQTPPSVVTNPAGQTVGVGGTVSFTATAAGSPSPAVQWQVSTDSGASFADILGATSTTLTFPTLPTQNGFAYRAVFSNAAGSATSAAAALAVQVPAAVAASTASQAALVNTAFTAPLVVTVTDAAGKPVRGIVVAFTAPFSGASVAFAGDGTATTDANGQASVTVAANGLDGSYTVTATVDGVSSAASFTLTNYRVVPSVVGQFPGQGVLRYDGQHNAWVPLTSANAKLLAEDPQGDITGEFPNSGVWEYLTASGWKQLTASDALLLVMDAQGDVTAEFQGYGVWQYLPASGWKQLTKVDAAVLAAGATGGIVGDFRGAGVWQYLPASGWQRLTLSDATLLTLDPQGYVTAEFQGYGVWQYLTASGWTQLTKVDAAVLAAGASGEVVGEFRGAGVWEYLGASHWKQLTPSDASLLVMDARGEVTGEFQGYGLWKFDPTAGWFQITASDAALIAAT